jgi:hypothetical protein
MGNTMKVVFLKGSISPQVNSESLRLLTSEECRRELEYLKATGDVTENLKSLVPCKA